MWIPAFAGMTCLTLLFCVSQPAVAAEKSWTGSGDASDWFDDQNWSSEAAPTLADDVVINANAAAPKASQTFEARSITLAGTASSSFTVDPLISGAVEPGANTDLAVYNRRDGLAVLKGSTGTVVLKGIYKDSEEVLANQPSLVFFVE